MGFCTAAELRDVLGMNASAAAAAAAVPLEVDEKLPSPSCAALVVMNALVCNKGDVRDGRKLAVILQKSCGTGAEAVGEWISVLTWLVRMGLSTLTGECGVAWREVSPRKGCLEPVGRSRPFMQIS